MKVIETKDYLKKLAQMLYDPDSPDEPLDMYDAKTFDIEVPEVAVEDTDELPTITTEEAMGKIEDEIEDDAGEVEFERAEDLEEDLDAPAFPSVFMALRWAKNNSRDVRIEYDCKEKIGLIRNVEPHGDFWARTTHRRIFVTWDQQMNGIRSFIGLNIRRYSITTEEFKPKFNFSKERENYMRRKRRKLINNTPFKRTL